MTAQGEGRGRKASVNCAAKDQSKSLLNNRIPVLTGVDRQGGPQPDLPERSSCKLVLRVLSFPFPERVFCSQGNFWRGLTAEDCLSTVSSWGNKYLHLKTDLGNTASIISSVFMFMFLLGC